LPLKLLIRHQFRAFAPILLTGQAGAKIEKIGLIANPHVHRGQMMNRRPIITEIDITRPARALFWLRLTDYVLVVMCGALTVSYLSELVINFPVDDPAMVAFYLIAMLFLGFAAYTGWRHVGVIDPAVWRIYSVLFPIFAVIFLLATGILLVEYGSFSGLMESKLVDTVDLIAFFYIACVALVGWTALILLQRLKITGEEATVGQILSQLEKQAGLPAKKAAEIKRINKPRGLVIGAIGLIILLAIVLVPTPDDEKLGRIFLQNIEQVKWLGFFLLVRARRYFQIDADALLAVDRRPPILFLRSFDDDEKQRFGRSDKAFLDFSLETRLSNHFSRFGPFVAIGSPKETVPQLGAARVLLSDEDWQPRVLAWMREAGLIIMYSGKTHWVNWELRQIIENDCATRLILMFPEIRTWRRSKRKAEISARVEQVRQVFKNTPWEEELMEFNDFPGLRAMLFRPDGSMVMVRSRSRSRDSYHLAALIAHVHLLDSDKGALAVDADEQAPRRRSLVAVGALAAAVIAVLGAVYLFSERGDTRLAFKQGELYFSKPVTEDEARHVGEYLVREQYFSDEQGSTVLLHQEQGRYRLQFVISPEYADDPLIAIVFGMIGKQIADDVLAGKPVEVGFTDDSLKPIMSVPLTDLMMFDTSELYYTEPVSRNEAHRVGEILVRQEIFSADRKNTMYIQYEQGRYRLRFVTSPEYVKDPLTAIHFGIVGKQIADDVIGGKPIELGLYDDQLKLVKAVPLSARMMFGKGELYYTVPVTREEARRVGEYLVQQQIFSDEQESTVWLLHEGGKYRLRFVISQEYAEDPITAIQFGIFGNQIARDALAGKPIEVEFADGQLNRIKTVPPSAIIEFGKCELYYSDPVTDAEANSVGNQLVKAGYFNDGRAASVHIARENDAFQLKFVINPSYKDNPQIKAAFIELSRGIASDALGGRPVVLHLCDGNFTILHSERLTYGPMGLTIFYNRS
jgi:hypothetical protein